jgi:hypothetical protein
VGPVSEPPGDECGGTEGVLALGLIWDVGNVVDDEVLELLRKPLEACGGFDAVHGWGEMGHLAGFIISLAMRLGTCSMRFWWR